MTATHLRLLAVTRGGHVHVYVRAGVPGFTYGLAGELTFTVDEWPNMRELLTCAGQRVELQEEGVHRGDQTRYHQRPE